MELDQTLNETLTRAIRARDTRTANVVRMLKTKIQERRTAKGASGEVDDAVVRDVIGAYRKQLQKALVEFEKAGERGAAQVADLRFEIRDATPFSVERPGQLRALALETLDLRKKQRRQHVVLDRLRRSVGALGDQRRQDLLDVFGDEPVLNGHRAVRKCLSVAELHRPQAMQRLGGRRCQVGNVELRPPA